MATRIVTTSSAQPAPGAAKPLLIQPLADLPGREIRITVLDRAPGSSSPPHRHPGHHTFGYVVEGTYEFAIDGQPRRILNAGETFYEPPTAVHSVSRIRARTRARRLSCSWSPIRKTRVRSPTQRDPDAGLELRHSRPA